MISFDSERFVINFSHKIIDLLINLFQTIAKHIMEAKKAGSSSVALNQDWRLECQYTDVLFSIKVQKLDHKSKFIKKFESIPERFQVLAESFEELASLLTSSKGIRFLENNLVVECHVGGKIRNVQIKMDEQKLSQEEQNENLHKLIKEQQQKQAKLILQHKNELRCLRKEILDEKKHATQLQQKLEKEKSQHQKLKKQIQQFNSQYVTCTKNGCGVHIAKKNIKHHWTCKSGVVCDQDCSYGYFIDKNTKTQKQTDLTSPMKPFFHF